jgi:hypothetical protein
MLKHVVCVCIRNKEKRNHQPKPHVDGKIILKADTLEKLEFTICSNVQDFVMKVGVHIKMSWI